MKKANRSALIYLIIGLLLLSMFGSSGARGYRMLSIFAFNTWTYSGTSPVHK